MCRWLAYLGQSIFLSELLFEPENSLIDQSLHARESLATTNGDGFGIGWYDARPDPGVFRDVLPAWNDDNLRSLAQQIRSSLFLAHVRASTGTGTSRQNCHPFRHGPWLFMHNGQIGGYGDVRRQLEFSIASEFYHHRLGTTDSEAMFLLAMTYGLADAPAVALGRMVGKIEALMAKAGSTRPLRISLALSDSKRIFALRYSSDRASPTMYLGHGSSALHDAGLRQEAVGASVLVLSEPLDDVSENWLAVDEASLVVVDANGIDVQPFAPVQPT